MRSDVWLKMLALHNIYPTLAICKEAMLIVCGERMEPHTPPKPLVKNKRHMRPITKSACGPDVHMDATTRQHT
jgi:hypothetical protein